MNSTCCQFDSGRSTVSGLVAFASCICSKRLATCGLNLLSSGLCSRLTPFDSTPVHGPGVQNDSSPVNRITVSPITWKFAGVGQALALGMALLIGSTLNASANPLVFTYSDDGTTSTITPSGSLSLRGLTHTVGRAGGTSSLRMETRSGQLPSFLISSPGRENSRTYSRNFNSSLSMTFSGLSSYTGIVYPTSIPDYKSPFYFQIANGQFIIDQAHTSGSGRTYTPDSNATFTGTLKTILGDSDFHIEVAINDTRKVIFTTAGTAPAMPDSLEATPGDGHVTLDWANPKNSSITGYEVLQKSDDGDDGAWDTIEGSDSTTTSHTIDGLENGERFSFWIRAVNFRGVGAQSDEVTAAPVKPGAPAAAELSAASTEKAGQVLLSWTLADDPSITEWQLQRREGDADFGDEWTAIDPSDAATRSLTIDGLSSEVAYGFRVRALNGNGIGAASRIATATPKAPEPGPTVEMEKQVLSKSLAAAGQATLAGVTSVIDQRLQSTPGTKHLGVGWTDGKWHGDFKEFSRSPTDRRLVVRKPCHRVLQPTGRRCRIAGR